MKFRADHKQLALKLENMDAIMTGIEKNIDQYFHHPCKSFRESDEALRLRQIDQKFELTYKGAKFNTLSKARKEINITIDNYDIIEDLFYSLGFEKAGKVSKTRENWTLNDIVISLDKIENLGEYVEFEMMIDDDQDLKSSVNKMRQFVELFRIDPDTQILSSYLELIESI